jgi:outer membrane protein assembly factor BamD (BamD/ComL family)
MQGLQFFFVLVGIGGIVGCATPPAPNAMAAQPTNRTTPEANQSSWFDRLTGRSPASSTPPTSSQVIQTSAEEPAEPAPLIASESPKLDDEDDGFDLSDLAPQEIAKDIKKAAGYGPNEGIARGLFKEGKALLDQKKFDEAVGKFKSAADRWPDSVLEEDALFLLGECYFFTDQYPKAQDTYDNLLKKYDNSRYLDTVVRRLFAIGHYWEQLEDKNPHWPITPNLTDGERPLFDTFGNALKAYETVRLKDPTGPLADDSIMATASAYFRKGRYEDAAYYYDLLRKEYPQSEHQLQAHVLDLQSKLRMYQGQMYDGRPLDEAEKIADQTIRQFRHQLGAEAARVAETRDRIAEQKAQRDWATAQFYEGKKQFGAARLYYQYIIKDHPASETARRAQARLEEIRNEPDQPVNRFRWLTDLFEEDD